MQIQIDFTLLYPQLFLLLWTIMVFVFDFFIDDDNKHRLGYISILGLVITGVISLCSKQGTTLYGAFRADTFGLSFNIIFIGKV